MAITFYTSAGLPGPRASNQSPTAGVLTAYTSAGGAPAKQADSPPDPPDVSRADGLRFSPGCCCSPVASGCLIGTDDFERTSSSDLGELWSERRASSGWQITGDGELVTAIPDDLAIYQIPHPDGLSDMIAWADVKAITAGDQLRVVIAWEDDDNYLFAELEVATSCGYLRLYQRKAGHTTLLKEIVIEGGTLGSWHTLYACFDPDTDIYAGSGRFEGRVETASLEWFTVAEGVTGVEGTYAGLATADNYGGAWFDNFELWKGQNENDPECPTCKRGIQSCEISVDFFDRPNNPDLGCLWEKITPSSDFQITGQTLATSISYDVVKHEVAHPDGESNLWARVLVKGSTSGDVARLILGWADVDNYVWAEVEIGACGTLRLYERVSGVVLQIGRDIPIMNATVNEWHTLQACYSEGTASADARLFGKVKTNNGEVVTHSGEATATGAYAGLATGFMSSFVYFDDFELEKLYSAANPECRTCEDPDDCTIIDDRFRRTELGLGCRWELVSGSAPSHAWVSPAGRGSVSFTDEGILQLAIRHPDEKLPADQWLWVEWTVTPPSVFAWEQNDKVLAIMRFYVGWLDSSNHYYVEVKITYRVVAGTPFNLTYEQRLFTAAGVQVGSTGVLMGGSQGPYRGTTIICYHGTRVHSNTAVPVGSGNVIDSWATTDTGGRHVGIGYGGGTAESGNFHRVLFERARNSIWEECKECRQEMSCTACSNNTMPDYTRITLTGVANVAGAPGSACSKCAQLNGSQVCSTWNGGCISWPLGFGGKSFDSEIYGRCCWYSGRWLGLINFPSRDGISASVGVTVTRQTNGNWTVIGAVQLGCGSGAQHDMFFRDLGSNRPDCDNWYRFEVPWFACYHPWGAGCDVCDFSGSKLLVTAV